MLAGCANRPACLQSYLSSVSKALNEKCMRYYITSPERHPTNPMQVGRIFICRMSNPECRINYSKTYIRLDTHLQKYVSFQLLNGDVVVTWQLTRQSLDKTCMDPMLSIQHLAFSKKDKNLSKPSSPPTNSTVFSTICWHLITHVHLQPRHCHTWAQIH